MDRTTILMLIAVCGIDAWNKAHGTNFKSYEEAREFYS